jgi:hypothetical protein
LFCLCFFLKNISLFRVLPQSLQVLSFSGSSDKVLSVLALELQQQRFPNLLELILSNGMITDAGICKLSLGSFSSLSRFDVRGNPGISVKSASCLIQNMRASGSFWWVQCDEPLQNLLQEIAREKFRAFFRSRHPVVLLQQTIVHDHTFAAVSPQLSLEHVCASLSIGLDIATVSFEDVSPLQCAVSYFGDGRVAQLLLAATGGLAAASKMDANGRNVLGLVPWMSPENLRALLEHGLDPLLGAGSVPGLVALATYAWSKGRGADERGWVYRFKLALMRTGKEVLNQCDADGETVLSVFARSNYAEVVDLLLSLGANVNCRDKVFRNTPLHWACKYGHANTVRLLLRSSDVNAVNAAGESALDLSRKNACAQVELELNVHLRNQLKKNGEQTN